jgi:hypothetical protein
MDAPNKAEMLHVAELFENCKPFSDDAMDTDALQQTPGSGA